MRASRHFFLQHKETDVKSVNRSALLVAAKTPYYEWANTLETNVQLEEDSLEPNVYLIDEYRNEDELAEIIHECFEGIFAQELAGWNAEEGNWPQDRTFDMFLDWFDVVPTSLVIDVSSESLAYDDTGDSADTNGDGED